jgi:hypothetical protein
MGTLVVNAAGSTGSLGPSNVGGFAADSDAAKPLNAAFSTWPTTVFEVRHGRQDLASEIS